MAPRRPTNSSAAEFARGGAGPGSMSAPLVPVRRTPGAQILRTVAALDGLRSSSRLGHGTRTTLAARIWMYTPPGMMVFTIYPPGYPELCRAVTYEQRKPP